MIRPLTCGVCRKELEPGASTASRWFPFCSQRCSNVDLLRWTNGSYAIVEALDSDEEAHSRPAPEQHPEGDPNAV